MPKAQQFRGRSIRGDFAEALEAAIAAAARGLNAGYFTWRLDEVGGSIGGFVGARDVTAAILASAPGMALKEAEKRRDPDEWYAWQDRMPGKPPSLNVAGSCEFPAPGYEVELRVVVPQGINPAIRLLEKVVTPPTGPVPQVITRVPVRYREVTSAFYSHVQILPENEVVVVHQVS